MFESQNEPFSTRQGQIQIGMNYVYQQAITTDSTIRMYITAAGHVSMCLCVCVCTCVRVCMCSRVHACVQKDK